MSANEFSKLLKNGPLIFGKTIPWKTCMVWLKLRDVLISITNHLLIFTIEIACVYHRNSMEHLAYLWHIFMPEKSKTCHHLQVQCRSSLFCVLRFAYETGSFRNRWFWWKNVDHYYICLTLIESATSKSWSSHWHGLLKGLLIFHYRPTKALNS